MEQVILIEKELEKLKEAVDSCEFFFLAPHLNPDGDAIGSLLAFHSMLKRMGKKVYLFSQDKVPSNLYFLKHIKLIKNVLPSKIPKSSAAVFFECSVPARAGNVKPIIKKFDKVISIDHHRTAKKYADINIIDFHSSSTAEIIFRFFYDIKYQINKDEAAALYTGIVTDTGRFHFPATSPRTHEVAARLLQLGFDFSKINDIIYATKQYKSVKMMARSFESLVLIESKLAVMKIKKSDFEEFSASNEHTENIINYGMMIPGIKISILFKEEKEKVVVTFRSKGNIDVSKIAASFGGGGHKNASGCKIALPFEEVYEKVISAALSIIK